MGNMYPLSTPQAYNYKIGMCILHKIYSALVIKSIIKSPTDNNMHNPC